MELSPIFNPRNRPCDDLIRSKFKLVCDMDLTHLPKTIRNNQVLQNPILHSFPYDFNRIVLKPKQHCLTDYINAYIEGHNKKRSLIVLLGQKKRHVYQYQYSAWSNGDIPKYPLEILEFIEISGTQTKKLRNPIIVHSSAGVGRTGTFIALDFLFQNLFLDNTPNISQTVKKLRTQRCSVVETLAQYEFLYDAIESYYLTRVYKTKGWL